jgi:hypothetical protein
MTKEGRAINTKEKSKIFQVSLKYPLEPKDCILIVASIINKEVKI